MALFSLALFSEEYKGFDDTRRNLTIDNAYANIPRYILNDVSWYFNSEAVCKMNLDALKVGESYQVGYKRNQQNYLIFTKTGNHISGQEPISVIIADKPHEPQNVIKRSPSLSKIGGAKSPRIEEHSEVIEKPINYQLLCNKFLYKCATWLLDKVNPKPILPTHV